MPQQKWPTHQAKDRNHCAKEEESNGLVEFGQSHDNIAVCLFEISLLNARPGQKDEGNSADQASKSAGSCGQEGVTLRKGKHCRSHDANATERQADVEENLRVLQASGLNKDEAQSQERGADTDGKDWVRVGDPAVVDGETFLLAVELVSALGVDSSQLLAAVRDMLRRIYRCVSVSSVSCHGSSFSSRGSGLKPSCSERVRLIVVAVRDGVWCTKWARIGAMVWRKGSCGGKGWPGKVASTKVLVGL